jgi:ubiquinone biosynthesis protein UbiJ
LTSAARLLGIEITSLDLTLYIELVTGTELRLMSHCEREPTPLCAAHSKTLPHWRPPMIRRPRSSTAVSSLQGSSASLITLQQVISRMEIDWEAPLVDAAR